MFVYQVYYICMSSQNVILADIVMSIAKQARKSSEDAQAAG